MKKMKEKLLKIILKIVFLINKYNSKNRIYSSSYRSTTYSNSSNQKSLFFNPVKKIPNINNNKTYSLTENSSITNSNIKNSYNHTFNIGSNFFKKIKKNILIKKKI